MSYIELPHIHPYQADLRQNCIIVAWEVPDNSTTYKFAYDIQTPAERLYLSITIRRYQVKSTMIQIPMESLGQSEIGAEKHNARMEIVLINPHPIK
jgi:hypothetical protein